MAKLTLDEIKKIRTKKRKEIFARLFKKDRIKIIVHMDETEILSGERKVLTAFKKQIETSGINNVILKQIAENKKHKIKPLVEIYGSNNEVYKYVDVTQEQVKGIFEDCILKFL